MVNMETDISDQFINTEIGEFVNEVMLIIERY